MAVRVEQGAVPLECTDSPQLANCRLVVRAKVLSCILSGCYDCELQMCSAAESLARVCCASCLTAGQIAGPPAP